MKSNIPAEKLTTGMYVILPVSWLKHGFLKGEFKITSPQQIERILHQGIKTVMVDLARSDPRFLAEMDYDSPETNDLPAVGNSPEPARTSLIPDSLTESLENDGLAPEKRADMIRGSATVLMERLFGAPTMENISQAKEAIAGIADRIVTDDETTSHLIRIASHDYSTYTHSVNVGLLGIALAKALYGPVSEHNLRELGAGFFLHDLGKVNVNPQIINKQSRLTAKEYEEMKIHPNLGYDLLSQTGHLNTECSFIVFQHHEREDGSGYPQKLTGREKHDYAKICSLADVYDALTAKRSYRESLPPFAALKLMRDEMSNHFAADMFARFVLMFK